MEKGGSRLRANAHISKSRYGAPDFVASTRCGPPCLFFGMRDADFITLLHSANLNWTADGDEGFDDGSCVLQFDIGDEVRLIAFSRATNPYLIVIVCARFGSLLRTSTPFSRIGTTVFWKSGRRFPKSLRRT